MTPVLGRSRLWWVPLLWASPVGAQPTFELDYRGVPACPTAAEFQTQMTAQLGYSPFSAGLPDRLVVRITPQRRGLQAVIELMEAERGTRRRVLRSAQRDCRPLAEAVRLTVAMIADPFHVPAPSAAAPLSPAPPVAATPSAAPESAPAAAVASVMPASVPPVPPVAAASVAPIVAVTVPSAAPSTGPAVVAFAPVESARAWSLWAGISVDQGSAPAISPGGVVAVRTRRDDWSFGIEGRAQVAPAAALAEGDVHVDLFTGGLDLCGHRGPWGACVIGQAGWQIATGTGFATNAQVAGPFLASGARLMGALALNENAYLRLTADVTATLSRLRLNVDDTRLWETSPIALTGGLLVGWRWGR